MPRDTGSLLTPTQREWLHPDEESDIEPGSPQERVIRSRIRERLRAGMCDANLIMHKMDPEDIRRAFERRAEPRTGRRDPGEPMPLSDEQAEEIALENGMASMIAVIYLAGIERAGREDDHGLTRTTFLKGKVKKGVRLALNALGVSVQQVAIDLIVDLGREYDQLADASPAELAEYPMMQLHDARSIGAITEEQHKEAMRRKGIEVPDDE